MLLVESGLGTRAGLAYAKEYNRICKVKYKEYYILKCDISGFFANIDHDILKEKLYKKIKDKEALKIIEDIIDSYTSGIGIGNMTSQILAIFYLNDLDHYIKEVLKIKYYVRYQDDFLLFHESKSYLKHCLYCIEKFLDKEKLKLNKKSRLYKNTNNFIFLGRTHYCKSAKYRVAKRRIKKNKFLYYNGKIKLNSLVSSIVASHKFKWQFCRKFPNKIQVKQKKKENNKKKHRIKDTKKIFYVFILIHKIKILTILIYYNIIIGNWIRKINYEEGFIGKGLNGIWKTYKVDILALQIQKM